MSPTFARASYAIVPIGLAGVADGIYQAVSGSPAFGALIGVIGLVVAGLAVSNLRAGRHWPFA